MREEREREREKDERREREKLGQICVDMTLEVVGVVTGCGQ